MINDQVVIENDLAGDATCADNMLTSGGTGGHGDGGSRPATVEGEVGGGGAAGRGRQADVNVTVGIIIEGQTADGFATAEEGG